MGYQDDFAMGQGLVVGSLTGFRYWSLGSDGVLQGHWSGLWETPEYVAECKAHIERKIVTKEVAYELDKQTPDLVEDIKIREITHWKDGTTTEEEVHHYYQVVMPGGHPTPPEDPDECKCGIYAGYAPDNVRDSGHRSDQLFGVIKATGRTIMGTRGFRTAKAQLVALSLEGLWEKMRSEYTPDTVEITSWGAMTAHRIDTPEFHRERFAEDQAEMRAKLNKRYPGVELFDTDADMMAAHKPDDLEALGIQNDGGHL